MLLASGMDKIVDALQLPGPVSYTHLDVYNSPIMMNSIFALPEYYLVEECSATSAGNHEWFTEMFLQQEKEEAKRLRMHVYQYTDLSLIHIFLVSISLIRAVRKELRRKV